MQHKKRKGKNSSPPSTLPPFKGKLPQKTSKISCFEAENDYLFHLQHNLQLVTHVVIGSGISGLTIASGLISSGVDKKEILILEARDRVGGRVLTGAPKACGAKLDCGAAWIHGSVDNPLNELLLRVNGNGNLNGGSSFTLNHVDDHHHSATSSSTAHTNPYLVHVADSNPWMHSENVPVRLLFGGKDGDESAMGEEKRQKLAAIWNEIASELGASIVDKTITDAFKEYVQSPKCTLSESEISELISFLTLVEVWSGGSAKTLSSSFVSAESDKAYNKSLFGDYEGPHSLFAKGAIGLVDALVKSCGVDYTDRILLNQIVTEVNRQNDFVEIRTNEGRVFRCKHLSVTIPPGPLKNIKFTPPLDDARVDAINRVKMGSYKKIQLEFAQEDVFWTQNDAKTPLIITRNLAVDPADFYLNQAYCEEKVEGTLSVCDLGPYLLWDNYVSLKGYPILEAICPAEIGWKLVGKTDEEIVDVVLEVLRMHYPSVPEPSGCFITRWEEDMFSQGAYSYHTIESLDTDAQVVYANINSQIFFAGEHTDPVFYGSLNAAYHSGVRVLNELGFCNVAQDLSRFANSENIFFQILQFLPKAATSEEAVSATTTATLTETPAVAPVEVVLNTSTATEEPTPLAFLTSDALFSKTKSKLISLVSPKAASRFISYPGPLSYMSANETTNLNVSKALRACLVPSFVDSNL